MKLCQLLHGVLKSSGLGGSFFGHVRQLQLDLTGSEQHSRLSEFSTPTAR
jgi:hypothetical protein